MKKKKKSDWAIRREYVAAMRLFADAGFKPAPLPALIILMRETLLLQQTKVINVHDAAFNHNLEMIKQLRLERDCFRREIMALRPYVKKLRAKVKRLRTMVKCRG